METALAAFHLLVEKDTDQAGSFARALDEQNRARQVDTRAVVDKAMQMAMAEGNSKDIIFAVTAESSVKG